MGHTDDDYFMKCGLIAMTRTHTGSVAVADVTALQRVSEGRRAYLGVLMPFPMNRRFPAERQKVWE